MTADRYRLAWQSARRRAKDARLDGREMSLRLLTVELPYLADKAAVADLLARMLAGVDIDRERRQP